jgi:NADPH-dependent ferric siderophore reductase
MRKRPPQRTLSLLRKSLVTPNMMRVTLGGDDLDGFPTGTDGGYVKLRLPDLHHPEETVVRTYTIRAQRTSEIDVDFALHGDGKTGGPATRWALTADVGDTITLGGPGPAKPLIEPFERCLIVGDMTALPAISVNLEKLSQAARGKAVIEIISKDDIQPLAHPAGVEIDWVINPRPGSDNVLSNHVRNLPWEDASTYAWVACEFSTMKALRTYFRDVRNLDKNELYVSSYWKNGSDEDKHRKLKQADASLQPG